MWGDILIAFTIAAITSFVLTPYTMRLAGKVGAMDVPNERKIHKKPIPRLGGLAIILGFCISVLYLIIVINYGNANIVFDNGNHVLKLWGFLVAVIVLASICFVDDKSSIKPIYKLLAQILASAIVVASGITIDMINIPGLEGKLMLGKFVSYAITVAWIVGVTNAINLIDGLDGLASGVSFISCLSLMIVFTINGSTFLPIILITALSGGIAGVLPYNVNPAKTFIGDIGSNFLGFSLAVISIMGVAKTYTAIVLIAPIIILAVPIFDVLFAMCRRIVKGKSVKAIMIADRGHLHHRLVDKGFEQKQVVGIMYLLTGALGVFSIILLESGIWKALSFGSLMFIFILIGYNDFMQLKEKEISEDDKNIEQ